MKNRGYKFLVMQTTQDGEHSMFLNSYLGGGGRSCATDTNVTHFTKHDSGGGHQNDDYWNSAEDLLVGFCRWYNRVGEKEAFHMGNRLYSATNTYRFFRVDVDMYSRDCPFAEANNNLKDFEITEDQFIFDIVGSWAFEQVALMFPTTHFSTKRTLPKPVSVVIVINSEFNSWCWSSDYLSDDKPDNISKHIIKVPVGYGYDEATKHISKVIESEYRFGGNDSYNKRNKLVD